MSICYTLQKQTYFSLFKTNRQTFERTVWIAKEFLSSSTRFAGHLPSSGSAHNNIYNTTNCYKKTVVMFICGPGSSGGRGTELQDGMSGDRIPVGAKFPAPVHTGPGAHPASSTMGTESFSGVKCSRNVTLFPHLLLVLWS
jgi:hypothetical protein